MGVGIDKVTSGDALSPLFGKTAFALLLLSQLELCVQKAHSGSL